MRLQYIDTELSVPDVVVQFVSLAFLSFADTEKKETQLAWCIRKRFFFFFTQQLPIPQNTVIVSTLDLF